MRLPPSPRAELGGDAPAGKTVSVKVSKNTRIGDRKRLPKMGYAGSDLDIEFILDELETLNDEQVEALESLRNAGL